MYWTTPPARLCSESSDPDYHALLFTIILFYFHASFTQPFRDEPEVVNVNSGISAVDSHIIK